MKIAICDDDALCREQVPDLGNAYIQQKNQDISVSVYDRAAALIDAAQRLVGYDIYTPDFFLGDPYVFMAISRLILCPAVQQSGLLHHFLNSIIEIRDASALEASPIFLAQNFIRSLYSTAILIHLLHRQNVPVLPPLNIHTTFDFGQTRVTERKDTLLTGK